MLPRMLPFRNINILLKQSLTQVKRTIQKGKYATQNAINVENAVYPSQKVEIKCQTINYVKVGKGPKNILCWPGAFGTIWSDFKPQIEELDKDKFTVIAWEPPGYGASRPPHRVFSYDFYHKDADFAHKLMTEKLGLEKFSILGWSDGGISGIILTSKHPENVEKLVIWGSNSYILPEEYESYKPLADFSKWPKRMADPLIKIYTEEGMKKMVQDWYNTATTMYKNGGNICKECVEKLVVPTLVMHGGKDPLIAHEHLDFFLKNIKNVKIHQFADGEHNIHLKYSKEFNKIVSDFIL